MDQLTLKASDGASFRVFNYGGHVSSWIPAGGKEQFFLSKTVQLKHGTPIRGGIPIIFPQFHSFGSLPKHGFARTSDWTVTQSGVADDGAAHAVLELKENIARLTIWPFVFKVELHISAIGNKFKMAMRVTNTGDTTLSFTAALHTYFAVEDILHTSVKGLKGTHYRDAVLHKTGLLEEHDVLHIPGEIDRIYEATPHVIEILQPHQRTTITTTGFADTVIWNPGPKRAALLNDMELGGENRMLCIEPAVIAHPVSVMPGHVWVGSQTFETFAI